MKYILISGSSDIGEAIINDLIKKDHEIIYTYNTTKLDRFKIPGKIYISNDKQFSDRFKKSRHI